MNKEQLVRQMVEYASGLVNDDRNLVDFIDRRKRYDGWTDDEVKVFNNVFTAVNHAPETERELIVKNYASELQDSSIPYARELEIGFRQAGAGILSTLARIGSAIPVGDARKKQLSEYADQLNRESGMLSEAADIANRKEGVGVGTGQNIRGAVSSIAQATATGWAGPYAMIAGFAATEGNAAITEAKDAGLNSYDTFKYAGRAAIIEGTVASIFQKIGLGGFEKYFGGGTITRAGLKGFLKSAGSSMLQELPEEIITEALHSTNRALAEVDPNALEPEVLFETVKSTIAQTLLAVGATATIKGASEQEFLKNREELVASTSEKWGLAPEIVESAIVKSEKVKGDKDVAFGRELLSAALQTERGVVTWMATYPEKAVALLGNENPSRKDFEELGLPPMSEEGRQSFVKQINDIMEEDINPEPENAVTPTQTGQPVAGEAPVEPVAMDNEESVREEDIPSVDDILNAGEADVLAEISGSLKAIAEAVNPDSEVTVETASRSLKEDADRLVAEGMLAEEDKDDFISQKLAEAGLAPDLDPTQVDAAGRNYLTDEKAVISLTVLNADPTTAVHEAVEAKIKSYFSDSDINSDEEMQAFRKSVIELGLPNYNNDKGMLEWMSDFMTDYVFASQNLRSMTGDEKANEVWDLVKQWRAKSKPGGRLAQMFDQLRQWFKETVGRAKQLRKALYSNPNNVDIAFANKILASEMNPDFGADIESDADLDVSYQLRKNISSENTAKAGTGEWFGEANQDTISYVADVNQLSKAKSLIEAVRSVFQKFKGKHDDNGKYQYRKQVPSVGYRIGRIPANGKSFNTRDGIYEDGISLISAGNLPATQSFAISNLKDAGADIVYVKGYVNTKPGGDDEFVMSDAIEITKSEYENALKSTTQLLSDYLLSEYREDLAGRVSSTSYAKWNKANTDAEQRLISSFNSSAGEVAPGTSYQLRSRPGAYAKAVAAYTDGDKSSFQLEEPSVGVGKMTGGYLVPENKQWNRKTSKATKRAVEKSY